MREPRLVRRRVSGAMPTVKDWGRKVVTVRQTPLMAMESPRWQSDRRVEVGGRVMVSVVPPSGEVVLRVVTSEGGVS